jgi:uncharacterized membrane protein
LLAVCASVYLAHYYPLLPKLVASHFDRHGLPNGWQTKQGFFKTFAGTTLLAALLVFGMPTLISIMPRRFVNLPNKDYWLAPQHRAASMEFLNAWFAWFGCVVYIVILLAFDYAVQTNLHSPNGPNPARLWYILIAFTAFMLVWTIRLFGRFDRVPRTPNL